MYYRNNRFDVRQGATNPTTLLRRKYSDPLRVVCDTGFLSDGERQLQKNLLDQVREAFSKQPTLGGVITGRREIKLGKRGVGRPSHFPSKKNAFGALSAVSLPVESRVESMFALELERNPDVWGFRTQAIELPVPGSKSPVFPDFLIIDMAGRPHLREVKADKRHLSPKTRVRNERLAAVVRTLGFSYDLVDASDMPQGYKSANLFWLHKQFATIPDQAQVADLLAIDFIGSTYGDLRARCMALGMAPSIVPYLLFTGRLHTYWDARITEESGVWK